MTKVIIIQGGNLDSYYEMTLEYLHQKYHTNPEVFGAVTSADQQLESSIHERLARDTAAGRVSSSGRGEAAAIRQQIKDAGGRW